MIEFSYEDLFTRNLGVVTEDEQAVIRSLTVAIAGCGGIGSPAAHLFGRLGIGSIRIADPEVYEPSNVNRQFGAYVDTIGRNKAEAMCSEIERMNPHVSAQPFNGGVNAMNVAEFIAGSSAVVDAIDFFNPEVSALLLGECARQGVWALTAQGAGDVMSVTAYDPASPESLAVLLDAAGNLSLESAISTFFPVLPERATPDLVASFAAGERVDAPSWVPAQVLGASIVVQEIVRTLVLGLPPAFVFPTVLVWNGGDMTFGLYRDGARLL